jgi:MYXO-CTERM domain-containing protein
MSRCTGFALGLGAAAALVASPALAHFILQAPASWAEQATLGDPQKSAPCGQADPGLTAAATGMVTAYAAGDTVTVTINETVTHPGHYRVVLSTTGQDGLPADPPVTAGSTPCGSTEIQNPPVFPVLADGMLVHTAAFSGPQSFTFKLPSNVTCASNCVLQVAEFMSNHGLNVPGGCFYHHCANITIAASGGAGGGGGSDAGTGESGGSDSGCGCAAGRGSVSALALLGMLALVAARRRRMR